MENKTKCPACGVEVKTAGKGKSLVPVDKKLVAQKKDLKIPFYCKTCGAIDFKYKAVRDVAFIYPMPRVEKIGLIFLPDVDYRGGNPQERYKDQGAYVLSIGEECFDPKKRVRVNIKGNVQVGDKVSYETRVPWNIEMKGTDGDMHKVVYCGFMDMYGVQQHE